MFFFYSIFSLILFAYFGFFTEVTSWEAASIAFFIFFALKFIDDLGKRIVILDVVIVLSFFTWLVMPVIFYHYYTSNFFLARLWVKYMPIPSDEYFSFVLPGTLLMTIGLKLPLGKLAASKHPQIYLKNLKKTLVSRAHIGFWLIGIGLFSGVLNVFAPEVLSHVVYLMEHLTYVGIFYVYFSDFKNKRLVILGVLALTVASSVVSGMFGELIFISAMSLIIILLEVRVKFILKLFVFVSGALVILIIQSLKRDYRQVAWKQGRADFEYFSKLVFDNVTEPSRMVEPERLFFTAVRMNQGWMIAGTMYRVPSRFPYAEGETIWKSVAASVVPRFLWPNKPTSGGAYNFKRFWGVELKKYAMNIGPIGEGYANFGRVGGMAFMLMYGIFFNLMFSLVLKYSERRPTILCWMPFLFFYAVGVETDLVTTMNSLVKAMFFMIIVFAAFKYLFRIRL